MFVHYFCSKKNIFSIYEQIHETFQNSKICPEITYKNFVIKPFEIRLKKNDFLSTNFLEFQKEIMKLLIKYNISKEVYCGSEDNYLLLDLSKKENIEILRRQLYSKGYINIRKVYFDENNLILRERTEENYKYINEVVFQITNYEDKQLRFEKNYYIRNSSNEWISMKLYMNEHFMDYFIINYLDKLVDRIKFLIPNYIEEGKNQLVIGIGCTGGHHRSVTIANELYNQLNSSDASYGIRLSHRDIDR